MQRKATIIKVDGPVHILVEDETGERHWMMKSQFDSGAPTEPGSKVWIEYRRRPFINLWVVTKGRK